MWSRFGTTASTRRLYAHLQTVAPGLRQGLRIGQGDSVGTVGMTGWATGPHLHFELKVHDQHVNPLTAELPAAEPLAASQLQNFALDGGSVARSAGTAGARKHRPRPPALTRAPCVKRALLFIGLMSGTSLDGVDAVLADCAHDTSKIIGARLSRVSRELRDSLVGALQLPGLTRSSAAALPRANLAHLYAACRR